MRFSTTSIIALAASTAIVDAMPFYNWRWSWPTHNSINGYNAPLTNGSATLSAFTPSKLKAIAIGKGTQNYTCADSSASTKPVAVGAIATLYNAGAMLTFVDSALGLSLLNAAPGAMLNIPDDLLNRFLPKAGHHYFSASGSPTFDLGDCSSGLLVGKKNGSIDAPQSSVHGAFGNAVAWLYLPDAGGSKGLTKAYRTMTAAGAPPASCEGQGKTIEVPYAAQYFFYEK